MLSGEKSTWNLGRVDKGEQALYIAYTEEALLMHPFHNIIIFLTHLNIFYGVSINIQSIN